VEQEAKSAGQKVPKNFRRVVVRADELNNLIRMLRPNATRTELLDLFDNRASWHSIESWRLGRRYVAPWAIQLLNERIDAMRELAARIKPGPGQSAGWRNVHGYAANKR